MGSDPDADARREATEAGVRAQVERGELDAAVSAAIGYLGPELHGYLIALARDPDLANDAFAVACEHLWRGLPGFRWEASLRTWAYRLARNALHHLRIAPSRRAAHNLPLSAISSLEAARRTSTAVYQRTDVKDAMRALREALGAEDHELLILRLDRGMAWKEIARALGSDDDDDDALDRRAASLRKRFERTKADLRALAIARGLVER